MLRAPCDVFDLFHKQVYFVFVLVFVFASVKQHSCVHSYSSAAAVFLDVDLGMSMLGGSRADGTMLLVGASTMIATTLAPRLVDYAFSAVVHAGACITALSLGDATAEKRGRITNCVIVLIISLVIAYKSERRRRENLLLAWQLRRSSGAASRAGAQCRVFAAKLPILLWKLCCVRGHARCSGREFALTREFLQRKMRKRHALRRGRRRSPGAASSAPFPTFVTRSWRKLFCVVGIIVACRDTIPGLDSS